MEDTTWEQKLHALTHILTSPTTSPPLYSQFFISSQIPCYLNWNYPPVLCTKHSKEFPNLHLRWGISLFLKRVFNLGQPKTSWRSKCPYYQPPPLILAKGVEEARWGDEDKKAYVRKRMECVAQGMIESQYIDVLENLLQGLSGVKKEGLLIHELVLKSKPYIGNVPSEVRLLYDLTKAESSWMVKHIGDEIKGEDTGAGEEQTSVLVRGIVESKTSDCALSLFLYLGYIVDYEMLKYGFAFHSRTGAAEITVTVSSVNETLKLHAIDEAVPLAPGLHRVEVVAPVTEQNRANIVSDVLSLWEDLSPLLHLSKPAKATEVAPTAAAAAASIMNKGGETTL